MGRQAPYKSTKARLDAGDFSVLVVPMDFEILKLLPDEGTSIGGLYQVGTSVSEIKDKLSAAFNVELRQSEVVARVRSMHVLGMTKKIQMVAKNTESAWQATPYGKEILKQWQSTQQ